MEEVLVLLLVAGVLWAHIKLREQDQPVASGTSSQAGPTVAEGPGEAKVEEAKVEEGDKATVADTVSVADQLPPGDLETVARDSGWFVDPLPDWLVPALRESTPVQVRSTGEPLDKESKKELGVNPNAKLGWDYVNALTEKGKSESPLDAPKILYSRASNRQSRKEELERAEKLAAESANVKVKITAAGNEGECDAVTEYAGREFSPETVPVLPLENCDSPYCRCGYAVNEE